MRLSTIVSMIWNITCVLSNRECYTIPDDNIHNCITFTVGPGTGCAWMCQYCETNLGTTNYYFTDGVCTYKNGGCVGNPVAGDQYTCCSV